MARFHYITQRSSNARGAHCAIWLIDKIYYDTPFSIAEQIYLPPWSAASTVSLPQSWLRSPPPRPLEILALTTESKVSLCVCVCVSGERESGAELPFSLQNCKFCPLRTRNKLFLVYNVCGGSALTGLNRAILVRCDPKALSFPACGTLEIAQEYIYSCGARILHPRKRRTSLSGTLGDATSQRDRNKHFFSTNVKDSWEHCARNLVNFQFHGVVYILFTQNNSHSFLR